MEVRLPAVGNALAADQTLVALQTVEQRTEGQQVLLAQVEVRLQAAALWVVGAVAAGPAAKVVVRRQGGGAGSTQVSPELLSISPSSVSQGSTITVRLTGQGTHWQNQNTDLKLRSANYRPVFYCRSRWYVWYSKHHCRSGR